MSAHGEPGSGFPDGHGLGGMGRCERVLMPGHLVSIPDGSGLTYAS